MSKILALEFTIPGQPVAKGRPRFARRGKHVVAYTPEKTASYESLVRQVAALAMRGSEPSAEPMHLTVMLDLQVPASWPERRRTRALMGIICATKKPDADNVLKGIKDGCNGIVWRDDSQVVRIVIEKRYAAIPCARVEIKEAAGEPA